MRADLVAYYPSAAAAQLVVAFVWAGGTQSPRDIYVIYPSQGSFSHYLVGEPVMGRASKVWLLGHLWLVMDGCDPVACGMAGGLLVVDAEKDWFFWTAWETMGKPEVQTSSNTSGGDENYVNTFNYYLQEEFSGAINGRPLKMSEKGRLVY